MNLRHRTTLAATLLLCLFGLFGVAATANAQTVTDERVWLNVILQDSGKTTTPWHWTYENIFRSRDGVEELDQMAFRGTLIYNLTSRSSIAGGYLIGKQDPAAGPNVIEHRFFGQYQWRGAVGGGTLTLRTRVESRVVMDDTNAVGRAREQVRFSRPFTKGNRLSWVGYDELFVNLNESNRYKRGIDHNRVFGGISATLTPHLRFEAGYLNQFIPGHASPDRMNHVLSMSTQLSF